MFGLVPIKEDYQLILFCLVSKEDYRLILFCLVYKKTIESVDFVWFGLVSKEDYLMILFCLVSKEDYQLHLFWLVSKEDYPLCTIPFLGAKAPLQPASSEGLYVCLYVGVCNTLGIIKYITQLPCPPFPSILQIFFMKTKKRSFTIFQLRTGVDDQRRYGSAKQIF